MVGDLYLACIFIVLQYTYGYPFAETQNNDKGWFCQKVRKMRKRFVRKNEKNYIKYRNIMITQYITSCSNKRRYLNDRVLRNFDRTFHVFPCSSLH